MFIVEYLESSYTIFFPVYKIAVLIINILGLNLCGASCLWDHTESDTTEVT